MFDRSKVMKTHGLMRSLTEVFTEATKQEAAHLS